jgi:4,5-dihydroxyphthalate decarboxylase
MMELSIALSENMRTKPIVAGEVKIEGISASITRVHPSEMFWRQLKYEDFDISEMSMSPC